MAPSSTVMNNDIGTLNVLAGIRYTSVRISPAYEFTAPPTPLRLSHDGKGFMPYAADVGAGNQNWQWNGFGGAGYHFRWGDTTLGCRNIKWQRSGDVPIEKVRITGAVLGATFRF